MHYKVTIKVFPKKDVLDFQARSVESLLKNINSNIKNCKSGKLFIYDDVGEQDEIYKSAKYIALEILSSPVSEDFEVCIEKHSEATL